MNWKEWIGKRIFVKLLNGTVYSGIVLDVDESFFSIKDKFGQQVNFLISQIERIKEEDSK